MYWQLLDTMKNIFCDARLWVMNTLHDVAAFNILLVKVQIVEVVELSM